MTQAVAPTEVRACQYIALCLCSPSQDRIEDAVAALSLPIQYEMPCGEVFRAETPDQVPRHNVACPCGNPNHAFVRVNMGDEFGWAGDKPICLT